MPRRSRPRGGGGRGRLGGRGRVHPCLVRAQLIDNWIMERPRLQRGGVWKWEYHAWRRYSKPQESSWRTEEQVVYYIYKTGIAFAIHHQSVLPWCCMQSFGSRLLGTKKEELVRVRTLRFDIITMKKVLIERCCFLSNTIEPDGRPPRGRKGKEL